MRCEAISNRGCFQKEVGALVLLLALACGGDEEGSSRPSSEAGEAASTMLSVREVWRSSPDLLLSWVRHLAVDSQGRVYVSDRNEGILLLDSRGRLLRNVGRRGEGPGEYQDPASLRILPGDSLLVYDFDLRRLTVYPPDSSAAAREWTFPRPAGRMVGDVRPVAEGLSYLTFFPAFQSSDPTRGEPEGLVAVVSGEGSVLDTLVTYPASETLVVRGSDFVSMASNPFGRGAAMHLGDSEIYFGWTDSLAVGIYDLAGARVGGFHDPREPVPVTPEDVEHAVKEFEGWDQPEEMTRRFIDALRAAVPETWPAFDRFLVDEQGDIWVDLTSRPESENEWSIYGADGERTGAFVMPASFDGRAVREDVLYGIETDQFDVPSIVAYRVEPAPDRES